MQENKSLRALSSIPIDAKVQVNQMSSQPTQANSTVLSARFNPRNMAPLVGKNAVADEKIKVGLITGRLNQTSGPIQAYSRSNTKATRFNNHRGSNQISRGHHTSMINTLISGGSMIDNQSFNG